MPFLKSKYRFTGLYITLLLLPLLAIACRVSTPTSDSQPTSLPVIMPTSVVEVQEELEIPQPILDEQSLLIELYKRVNPSVVNITTYVLESGDLIGSSQGSGFIFDTLGHVVTNAHVVHGASAFDVSFSDGTIREAEVVGEDLNSDLAVLKVSEMPPGTTPLPLGNIDDVQVGQTVLAIGNPFGLNGTLTRGIVSALGRSIPALTPFSIPQSIQTDAPINPGNSGGPLLNLQGEVIGVNAQIETSNEDITNSGVGFAIPVNIVARVAPTLIEQGSIEWAWLGVRGGSLTPTIAQAMGLPFEKGAYIYEIIDNGPAQKAGLRGASGTETIEGRTVPVGGDVILAIDGVPVTSFDDIRVYIALESGPGQEVTLTIMRGNEQQDIRLLLEARPETVEP